MSRPRSLAVGVVTALVLVTGGAAQAGSRHVSVRVQSRAHRPAGSVALFGAARGTFQAVKDITGPQARKTVFFGLFRSDSVATSVNPAGGDDGLICGNDGDILPVRALRTTPHLQERRIDARRFLDEGGPDFDFFCDGVAVQGKLALATGDSQGLVQLIRRKGTWQIDTRVRSPGLNDGGVPHRPGWIAFRDSTTTANLFRGVDIAPRPLADGTALAVAIDRTSGTVVVVRGVGTAKPQVVGALQDDVLQGPSDYGNGGIAFLPGSRDRAVVLTGSGFAVLTLHDPSTPRLKVATTLGDGLTEPTSITVSHDGRHLAVAAGPTVYGFSNVQGAASQGTPFHAQTSFSLATVGDQLVSDVAYTGKSTLVVLHGRVDQPVPWHLTLVKNVPAGHHSVKGSTRTTPPDQDGSLSVWPSP